MARQRLAEDLVRQLVAAFEPALPQGVYLVLAGRDLSARRVNGGGSAGGFTLGAGAPPFPMPEAIKFRMALDHTCEEIARAIGFVAARRPRSQPQLPMWPEPDAAVKVDVSGDQIVVRFVAERGRELMALAPVAWPGPRFVEVQRRDRTTSPPRRYFGPAPAKDMAADRRHDSEKDEQQAAMSQLLDVLRAQDLGTNKTRIRRALRAEIEARHIPNVPPDSRSEGLIVDAIAAVDGKHPSLQASLVAARETAHLARLLHRVMTGSHIEEPERPQKP